MANEDNEIYCDSSLLAFVVINGVMPTFTIAGLIDMGYGSRGGKYAVWIKRSEELHPATPISFDYDRPK